MIVKLSELHGILGISKREINILAKKGIIPRAGRGEYELAGAVQAYIHFKTDGDPDKKTSLHDQEIKLKKAQTKKLELEIERLEGILIPVSEMQKLWERHIVAARTNFLLIENEVPRIRSSKDNTKGKEIYRKAANSILTELAQAQIVFEANGEDDPDDAEALEPAALPHHKPVGRRKHVAKP